MKITKLKIITFSVILIFTIMLFNLRNIYDFIRMLDADGYPHAFLEIQGIRLEFRRVSRRCDGLYADVRIVDTDQSSSG